MEEGRILTKKERRKLAKEEKRREREKKELLSKIKKFLMVAVPILLVVFIGYKTFNLFKNPASSVLSQRIEITDTDWVRGERQAKVSLVEYGDFQCPACANYEPLVQRLLQEFPKDLRLVYRHFPLDTIHRNAYAASRASEAAGKQGKFWEMHDILYERQKDWEKTSNVKEMFVVYAKELGLDEEKFKSDFDSKEIEERINHDLASGRRVGINSTPTFILNGQKIQPRSYDEFKRLVEDQIKGYTIE